MPKGKPGTVTLTHGTVYGYFGLGCRCEACRDAMRRYEGVREAREVRTARLRAEASKRHGSESSYSFGCRCDLCREAARVARARRRSRAA